MMFITSGRKDVFYIITLALIIIPFHPTTAELDFDWKEGEQDESGGLIQVESVLGQIASLPCDIESNIREHRVYMVLWFKENGGKPLYNFDVRGRAFKKALHWSDNNTFGPRATFVTNVQPAHLRVENIQLRDEGVYRCRVDFRNAPSRNFQINLVVIVPPYQIIIYDSSGREVNSVVGSLIENIDIHLTCEVRGGKPPPLVYWYSGHQLTESAVTEMPDSDISKIVISRLSINGINRFHHNTSYSCQASNTDLIEPQKKTVTLQLHLQPTSVRIIKTSLPSFFVTHREYKFICEVTGSIPDPRINWFEEGVPLLQHKVREYKANGTTVLSELTYTLQDINNDHTLKCAAENSVLMNSSLEDWMKLNVHFSPIVSLQLGNSLDPNNIKEGDDVYFECRVRSNPLQRRIFWHHNGLPVLQNLSSGVILSTESLVLQGVLYKDGGNYTCRTSNEIGETISPSVHLRVKYAPRCSYNNEAKIIGASLEEVLRVLCTVLADPADVSFSWQFNNSVGESLKVDPAVHYNLNGTTSELIYKVSTELDYGTLICRADNEIGRQMQPCVFRIIPAVKPPRLQNCTLDFLNAALDEVSWIKVDCIPGSDDGLHQLYHLDVVHSNTLLLNLTNRIPTFYIDGSLLNVLELSLLQVYVYSTNLKGKSEITLLMGNSSSSKNAEKRTEWVKTRQSNIASSKLSTVLASSLVGVGVIITLFVILLIQL